MDKQSIIVILKIKIFAIAYPMIINYVTTLCTKNNTRPNIELYAAYNTVL